MIKYEMPGWLAIKLIAGRIEKRKTLGRKLLDGFIIVFRFLCKLAKTGN